MFVIKMKDKFFKLTDIDMKKNYKDKQRKYLKITNE